MAAEQEEIARRRRLADMLRQQSAQPEGQMVGGRFVAPSITQRLAGLFNAYSSGRVDKLATDRARQVGQQFRENQGRDMDAVLTAFQGGQRGVEGMPDETGNPTVQMERQPGNPQEAMRLALRSGSPAVQQLGSTLLAQALKAPESPFAKINPKDFTPESVRAFVQAGGRDFSMLTPASNINWIDTGRELIPTDPRTGQQIPGVPTRTREMSPDATGRIAWDQFVHGNPSAADNRRFGLDERRFGLDEQRVQLQRAGLQNDAARLGLERARTYFDTGMTGMGGGAVPPAPGGPAQMPPQAPAQPQQGAQPAPVRQPMPAQGGAPVAPPAGPQGAIPPAMAPGAGMTPKAAAAAAAEGVQRRATAARAFPEQVSNIRNMIDGIDRATQATTGATAGALGTALGMVPGTPARDLQATINTLRANLAFGELQRMRAMSPTGGALGAVSERELTLLESALQSLDRTQSPQALRENLGRVRTHYVNWARALAESAGMPMPELPADPQRAVSGGQQLPQPAAGGDLAAQAAAELARRQGR